MDVCQVTGRNVLLIFEQYHPKRRVVKAILLFIGRIEVPGDTDLLSLHFVTSTNLTDSLQVLTDKVRIVRQRHLSKLANDCRITHNTAASRATPLKREHTIQLLPQEPSA